MHHEEYVEHHENEEAELALKAMKSMFFKSQHGQKYLAEHNQLVAEETALCDKWDNFKHRYSDDLKAFIEMHQR